MKWLYWRIRRFQCIYCSPETVVVELVVAGHGDESAPRRTQGVEHL